MSDQIIELAIRAPKKGREADFARRKDAAVDALLSVPGVGPERAFVAFSTLPPQEPLPHVGMTLYADKATQGRATRNFGVLSKMLPFMGSMTMSAGVFLTANDVDFDLATFASEPGRVVEFAALKPAKGVTEADFLAARAEFLKAMDGLEGVVRSHTFTTVGGLKAKDSLVHFTIYQNREALDTVAAALSESGAFEKFRAVFAVNSLAFTTAG